MRDLSARIVFGRFNQLSEPPAGAQLVARALNLQLTNWQYLFRVIAEKHMVKVRFAESVLRGLKPRKVRYDVQDPAETGLVLRVTPQGRKTWLVSYRSTNGVKLQRPIGKFPAMGISEARDFAAAALNGDAGAND